MNATDTAPTIEHRIGETGSLTVRVANWSVEVVAVSSDTVRVRNADGGKLPDHLEVEAEDGILSLRQPGRLPFDVTIGRRSSPVRLAIEAPRHAAVTLQSASGDLQVTSIHGPIRTKTASGDVLLVDVAGELETETVSGDVAIRLDDPAVLAVRTVSGDVIVEGGRVDRFAFQTTSGDLRLASDLGDGPFAIATVSGDALITTRNGIRVLAQTVTGDLSSDLPHTSEGRSGRRSLTVGEGSNVVQFRSVSGDLRVVGPGGGVPTSIPVPPPAPNPPAPVVPPVVPVFATDDDDDAADDVDADDVDADDDIDTAPASTADPVPNPATEAVRLDVLRALERGEIDVEEATSRLAALDGQTDD